MNNPCQYQERYLYPNLNPYLYRYLYPVGWVPVGQRIWKKSGTFVAGKKYINGSWNSSPPGMHIIVHWPQVILIVDISLTFDAHRWRHNSSTSDGATLILLVTACCAASPSNNLFFHITNYSLISCVINVIFIFTLWLPLVSLSLSDTQNPSALAQSTFT